MTLTNEAAAGGSEASPIAIAPAPAGDTPLGAREAARNLASWRHNRDKKDTAFADAPKPVQESAEALAKADTGERPGLDPAEAPPSETESADREAVTSADLSAEALAKAEASAQAELPSI